MEGRARAVAGNKEEEKGERERKRRGRGRAPGGFVTGWAAQGSRLRWR